MEIDQQLRAFQESTSTNHQIYNSTRRSERGYSSDIDSVRSGRGGPRGGRGRGRGGNNGAGGNQRYIHQGNKNTNNSLVTKTNSSDANRTCTTQTYQQKRNHNNIKIQNSRDSNVASANRNYSSFNSNKRNSYSINAKNEK